MNFFSNPFLFFILQYFSVLLLIAEEIMLSCYWIPLNIPFNWVQMNKEMRPYDFIVEMV